MRGVRTAAAALMLASSALAGVVADSVVVEETNVTKDERQLFEAIAKADPSFHWAPRARRYYRVHPETKTKLPVLVELVFGPPTDGLYFGEFVSYAVTVDPDSSVVTYAFDAGTALRGHGTAMVTPGGVVRTEQSCGTTDCSVRVTRGTRVLFDGR